MVTTHYEEIMRGQLIVSSIDPAGPWSDPAFVQVERGIDPDLAWDEDGTCHLTWALTAGGIMSVPVNPDTGEILGEPRRLWSGTGMAYPEGPHLYRIGDYWYLLIAEGGTERGHSVSIARARNLAGVWEPGPANPILSHRSTDHVVQNTGHADLVQRTDGSWAMVHLGTRPRGMTPKFHTNGRETFLVGIDWVDGWPLVDEDRFQVPIKDHSFNDDFTSAELDSRWISVGVFPEAFTSLQKGGLALSTQPEALARSVLATRVRDLDWSAEVDIHTGNGSARFAVRIDPQHWYGIEVTPGSIEAKLAIGPAVTSVGSIPRSGTDDVRLRLVARTPPQTDALAFIAPDLVSMEVVPTDGSPTTSFGEFDGRYLSTEVAGGFTGRVIAVEPLVGEIRLSRFSYRTEREA